MPDAAPTAHDDRDRILARLAAPAKAAAEGTSRVVMTGEGDAATWVARANGEVPISAAVIALNVDDRDNHRLARPECRIRDIQSFGQAGKDGCPEFDNN